MPLDLPPAPTLTKFELELELRGGESKEWELEIKDGWYRAEVEYEGGGEELTWTDARALREVLGLVGQLDLRPTADGAAIARHALAILGVDPGWVAELELEVAFSDGQAIEFEYALEEARQA